MVVGGNTNHKEESMTNEPVIRRFLLSVHYRDGMDQHRNRVLEDALKALPDTGVVPAPRAIYEQVGTAWRIDTPMLPAEILDALKTWREPAIKSTDRVILCEIGAHAVFENRPQMAKWLGHS